MTDADVRYARKDRRDALTGEMKPGPTHIVHGRIAQSLCGRRIPVLSHWTQIRPEGPKADHLCKACMKHEAEGTAASWRRR